MPVMNFVENDGANANFAGSNSGGAEPPRKKRKTAQKDKSEGSEGNSTEKDDDDDDDFGLPEEARTRSKNFLGEPEGEKNDEELEKVFQAAPADEDDPLYS